MSRFFCSCTAITQDDDFPDAQFVAYPQPVRIKIEERIAESVAKYFASASGPERIHWLADYFHAGYPTDLSDKDVIEDIVTKESMDGLISMFRCPVCDRLWLCDPVTELWESFRPERKKNED